MSKLSDTFPELYQLRYKSTLVNCEKRLKEIKRRDWKLAKDLVSIKLEETK